MTIKREPSAEFRFMASTLYQAYLALREEGFSPDEALKLVIHMLPRAEGPDE